MFAGGALRDLAPTAFAHHEEWQAVLHGMRYELDVAFRRNFRLEDDDDAVRQDVSEPDWDADARAEEQTEVEQVEQESEYEDRTAGIREEDFAYFTRIFYEVYLQYYRGGYQSRVAEFSRRLLFVVGGDDPIVRTKNVLEAAPKGMTLLQIADVSHFPASRGRGPDGGKAETEQRKYWLPEIGRVIANFSERAEGLLANTLSTSWNAAAGAGRGPRSEASRLQPLEQAPEFLDSLAFAGELRRLVELIEPARRRLKGEPTGPGWLLISRNEVPPVFMGTTGFRFHGQAVHHAEQQIAEYVRTLHERARRIFRRRDRTTLLIPSAGDRWFWNTKFVSMSETPSAARVPDETNKRRMIAAFQRWVRSGVVREAVADEYAIPSERLGKLGDVVAAKIDTSRVSLTILPDVWIALSARVLKRLRGDVAEDDREENEQAIVKWARRLVPQAGDPLTELQEDLDSGDVLAITVSAAELSPRYRGRRLLSAKNVAAAIVHWALAYEASDVATRAPPMKTEKPPQPPPDALVAADGAQVDASPDPASGLALAIS